MRRREILQQIPLAVLISLSPEQLWHVAHRAHSNTSALTLPDAELLGAIVDIFLPATGRSPSATEAGVPGFIAITLDELIPPADKHKFFAGLQAFAADVTARLGKVFQKLTLSEQNLYLREQMEKRDDFCMQLKKLAMTAYFSSEQGMTQALEYNPIPGKFTPCLTVTDQTKAEAMYY